MNKKMRFKHQQILRCISRLPRLFFLVRRKGAFGPPNSRPLGKAPSQTISDMWLVPFQGIDGSASLRPSEHWDPSNGIHPPGSSGGSVVATWLDSRIFLNLVFCIEKHLFTDKCCSMWLGCGLKIGQKSSLAIFNLQSSIFNPTTLKKNTIFLITGPPPLDWRLAKRVPSQSSIFNLQSNHVKKKF